MARLYSVQAGTRRWPIHVFYKMLDLAAINAWILFREVTGKKISRQRFILQLADELREQYVNCRSRHTGQQDIPTEEYRGTSNRRRQCQIADNCKQSKTTNSCSICKKFVCGKCTAEIKKILTCVKCSKE